MQICMYAKFAYMEIMPRPSFFITWFTDFFQKFQVGGGKKIKIKISKIFNLKNILVLGNKRDKTK